MVRLSLVLILLLIGGTSAAEAKSYSAERFDSRVEVMPGGALRVTETVVFRFEGGPFREVFRQLRTRDTDGVEFVGAAMNGAAFPEGDGPGTVEVRRRSRVEITWHFAPVSDQTHTFELTYIMRGVVRGEAASDTLEWTALPAEHKYPIASSTIEIALPASPLADPDVEFRRVDGDRSAGVDDGRIRITATRIRSNGWIKIIARMPQGSAIEVSPEWQQKQRDQQARAPVWMAAAGAVLAAGLILLFAVRQGYDAPPREAAVAASGAALPDTLAPAEAGALVANGAQRIEHAMATLFALAERGELTIHEEPKKTWGQRRYTLTSRPARRPVAPYEQAALDIVFTHGGQTESTVALDKARSRLTWHFKRFGRTLENELKANGLLDADRKAVRRRFGATALIMFLIAACVIVPLAVLTMDSNGPWPLLIPLALAVVALVALICHAAHTPLSNEGLRRARSWRGFQAYLKDVAHDRTPAPANGADRMLPYAVALGLADGWSKFMKKHRVTVPPWFQAAAHGEGGAAFVALVAYGGASAGGGAGTGGVSGAGGGASGAR